MRQDAFIGLIVLCGLVLPAVVWLVLRWWAGLATLSPRIWLALYGLGALMCVAVLPRKHLEAPIVRHWPRSYWAYTLAQVDNEIWEQLGKLAAMLIVLWLAAAVRALFREKRTALAIGFWTGLSYGFGEALILSILFINPGWGRYFGVQMFTLQMIGWDWVYERLLAMQMHAVMGALVGLGLYGWIGLGSKRRLLGFFVLAMLYHHFVDAFVFTPAFVPALVTLLTPLASYLLPALVVVGYLWMVLWYLLAGKRQPELVARSDNTL